MTADHSDDLERLTGEQLTIALIREVRGLRLDVKQERVGRKGTRRVGGLVAVVGLLVALIVGKGYVDARTQSCENRNATRADVRAAIGAGVDEVGEYADLTPLERSALGSRVDRRVAEQLPAIAC